jgi:hypothetical protein
LNKHFLLATLRTKTPKVLLGKVDVWQQLPDSQHITCSGQHRLGTHEMLTISHVQHTSAHSCCRWPARYNFHQELHGGHSRAVLLEVGRKWIVQDIIHLIATYHVWTLSRLSTSTPTELHIGSTAFSLTAVGAKAWLSSRTQLVVHQSCSKQ